MLADLLHLLHIQLHAKKQAQQLIPGRSSLSALHQKGFIHRDVKPENILLTSEGRVVLLDLDASIQPDPERVLSFHITFWEKNTAGDDYREITNPELLQHNVK